MEDKNVEAATELKPGETIHPATAVQPATPPPETAIAPTPLPVLPPVQAAQPQTQPDLRQVVTSAPAPTLPAGPEIETTSQTYVDDGSRITWTASEFIEHSKSIDWYIALAVVAVLSSVGLYVLFRDVITSITPLVAALALGFYGKRKPRQLQYQIDSQGLSIADKFFPYEQFRSFAIMEEGPFASLVFLPLKRFGMLTTVYLDPQDEDRIVDMVADYLPLEPRSHDAVDRLMKRIRF